MADRKVLGIGLIGAGGMGAQHAANIRARVPAARLAAVYDIDQARAHNVAGSCGGEALADPFELIRSVSVDAVVVAAPDALHARFVLACLEAGKPVLCEKPLAADAADALAILRAEEKLGKRLVSVGFNRRFDPAHADVKKACASGEIGAPLYWKGAHRNPEAMYNTSGPFILTNSAGHDIDSARWLLGSDVAEVFVKGLRSRPELPEDARDLLVVQMTMANGLLATAEVFVNARYGYEVIAEVVCSEGSVTTFPTSPADTTLVRSHNRRGTPVTGDFRAYFNESYALEMAEWVASVLEGRLFSGASAWDGYAAVAVSAAAGKSLVEGRALAPEMIERPRFYS